MECILIKYASSAGLVHVVLHWLAVLYLMMKADVPME